MADAMNIQIRKNTDIPDHILNEPEVISSDVGMHPRTVETFGAIRDADK